MRTDFLFEFAKAYNVDTADVVKGTKFSVIGSEVEGNVSYYSNNDEVLSIKQQGKSAAIEATALGSCHILVFAEGNATPVKQLRINVVESLDPATQLNTAAGDAVLK